MSSSKMWGKQPFWGISSEFDPLWCLNDKQKDLQTRLIDLCRREIRPHAIQCDKTYTYPRKSLDAMAKLGLLGLVVPKQLGGLGESHQCASMVVETIARYGCPSTAMIYTMHLGACATVLFRYHNSPTIQNILRRLDKDKLVGTLSYSDPATGGHFWFPLSSKTRWMDENTIKLLKYGSWATSAGFADWYAIQTVSPSFNSDYSNLSCFLILKEEVRASTDDWSAMGMHGNQSGPLICEGLLTKDRMIGPEGDGQASNDECVDPYFLLMSSSCWNGISMGSMDIVKKHVTRKAHADVGMRVCDYPTIQDYFGEMICGTNACRLMLYNLARAMDDVTNNNDWSLHSDLSFLPRANFLTWLWQMKFQAAKNVGIVTETMLHAAGGSGYKTDLGLERLYRDGKSGWVMGPSNEVLRQFVGKVSLLGMVAIDYWEQKVNRPALHQEMRKMTAQEKRDLARQLLEDANNSDIKDKANKEEDFENPFNTCPPLHMNQETVTPDGTIHRPALSPAKYVKLSLQKRIDLSDNLALFRFDLPNPENHLGCYPGHYVHLRIEPKNGMPQERYFSPVSRVDQFGYMDLILKFESQGIVSQHFKALKPGDKVEVKGPNGGFEYETNILDHLTLLASGCGVTPGIQLVRTVMANPEDLTKVTLLYFSETYQDILCKEELDEYAANDPRLTVIYSLGESPEDWDGEEGFIDTDMIDRHVIKPNCLKHKVVMCGGPTMVISCLYSLRSLQFSAKDIFIYGQFGTEQVRMVYGRNVQLSGHRCNDPV